MATKHDLEKWVLDAVRSAGGSAQPIHVARHVWAEHESDLRDSGDLFYTWQYDLRWAAQRLATRVVSSRRPENDAAPGISPDFASS